jgi:2-polyprenyl-6-methoxyphenol hydroxylase-like FAD-dependent oxidoreductase
MASPFKVLIVGGSIAGLALANMLEAYGIDYVLLEKHAAIAPQLGASIVMMPSGLRILEQIGQYKLIESLSSPVNKLHTFNQDGQALLSYDQFGQVMENLCVLSLILPNMGLKGEKAVTDHRLFDMLGSGIK